MVRLVLLADDGRLPSPGNCDIAELAMVRRLPMTLFFFVLCCSSVSKEDL